MEKGNAKRKKKGDDILARCAVKSINQDRPKNDKDILYRQNKETAYIFNSLKHHEECKFLKKVYGASYYQIGVYSDTNKRIDYLRRKKNISKVEALVLIEKDMFEKNKHGQKTRKVFELSDFFISHDYMDKNKTKEHIIRIFDLIFGNPYLTPTIDEHMMYMAYTYSTRSADLSRQVGAVIANKSGDILSLGSNDVPRPGGGPYWSDHNKDYRDYRLGEDSNQVRRDKMLKKARETIIKNNFPQNPKDEEDSSDDFQKDFEDSGLLDVTEYGRSTHAEMSAILSCARNGVSLKGHTLYCTTYPCHNCAKHIIDSGIKKVLFVETLSKKFS